MNERETATGPAVATAVTTHEALPASPTATVETNTVIAETQPAPAATSTVASETAEAVGETPEVPNAPAIAFAQAAAETFSPVAAQATAHQAQVALEVLTGSSAPQSAAPAAEPTAPDQAATALQVRRNAAELLGRFLGKHGAVAQTELDDLLAEEIAAIVVAGVDRHTARAQIKDILTQAYDRRREAAAVEARARDTSGRRSSLAQRTLETFLQLSAESANAEVSRLSEQEQEQLAQLVDSQEAFTAEQVGHVLKGAAERIAAAK